jgi:hypothetical protein
MVMYISDGALYDFPILDNEFDELGALRDMTGVDDMENESYEIALYLKSCEKSHTV